MTTKKLHDNGEPLPESRRAINFADGAWVDEAEAFCEPKTRFARSLEEFVKAMLELELELELELGEFTVSLEAKLIESTIETMRRRWARRI